ncbi:MAG: YggS family pyridoxal phosphate-dependent enzyme [Betaproteobacteria bacterium]|nr:YggS family pyridoxal phosphate-dependent enzyme [Betaproteobacteria bacterium]
MNCILQAVQHRIELAAGQAGRDASQITLLAVSKTVSAARVRELALQGQRNFGENYVQEALDKIASLQDLPLIWHFIGPIQRNKTTAIATQFDWVHSVDRFVVAQRLSEARPLARGLLNVCVQVNLDAESSKSGVSPAALPELAEQIARLPNLRLRGLMTIPRASLAWSQQRAPFAALRKQLEALRQQFEILQAGRTDLHDANVQLDTLSMGMSADLEAAIMEGSTCVRIGSALFGKRI